MSDTVENAETPSPADVAAQAMAEAAAKAPTTEAEARTQVEAEEAAAKAAKKAPAERPEWLDEKFATPEDLAKAYKELQAKLGAPKDEPKAAVEEDKTGGDAQKPEEKKADEPAEAPKASEVVAKLNENFAANGKLSDEDYAAAEKIGHDRATVDAFIEGQKALAEIATQRITTAAGGKEAMDTMFVWAKTGLTGAEIDTFNATMQGSDVSAAVTAMEQLKAKYEATNGKDPTMIGGKPAGASVDAYTSWAEVQRDMAKPEYAKDHAFRAKVEAKLGRSNNIR
ncbi:hypothetical protein CYK37_30080 [Mesorhizobium loti]|nr:hypothetical protein [Mesorhizobium loti]PLP55541.1 hypothetical protein CYK37_30080 [Mesorhizobium loti]